MNQIEFQNINCGIIGVYQIENLTTHRKYIGSSKNILQRWCIHMTALQNNHHHCEEMQLDYNSGHCFYFSVVEKFLFCYESDLLNHESKFINACECKYNKKVHTAKNKGKLLLDQSDEALRAFIEHKKIIFSQKHSISLEQAIKENQERKE